MTFRFTLAAAAAASLLAGPVACAEPQDQTEQPPEPQQGGEDLGETLRQAAEQIDEELRPAVEQLEDELAPLAERLRAELAEALGTTLTADVINRDRETVGAVTLTQGATGVLVRVVVDDPGLAAGWHGAHLHMIGDCSNEDFTSSGGHINPDGRAHGLLHPDGPDNADMPNLYVHEDGALRAEVFTTRVSLQDGGSLPGLLDADGSAFVMHANPDDHETQPIGGAGPRVLCAVIDG